MYMTCMWVLRKVRQRQKQLHFKVGFKIQTVERYRKRESSYLHGIRTHRKLLILKLISVSILNISMNIIIQYLPHPKLSDSVKEPD